MLEPGCNTIGVLTRFGFIQEEGTKERFFVHVSGLLDEVQANDKVVFETERGPRGMNAVRVRKA